MCQPQPLPSSAPGAPLSRAEAVAVARTWIGTPYVLKGRVKGAGCDCGTFLAEWLLECRLASEEELADLGFYSHDWFCNTSQELYLLRMMRHARLVVETICRGGLKQAQPGDLVMFRVAGSKLFNHGGIVTQWPRIVHGVYPQVAETNAEANYMTAFTEMCVFSPWEKPEKTC
jgi:cell wall-associated NlpC family hydrolase